MTSLARKGRRKVLRTPSWFRVLPLGKRHTDPPANEQTLRFKLALAMHRTNPFIAAFTVSLVLVSVPLMMVLAQQGDLRHQQTQIQKQRRESITLLCKQNHVLIALIVSNPEAVGAPKALKSLNSQNCQELLREIDRTTR